MLKGWGIHVLSMNKLCTRMRTTFVVDENI